MQSRFRETFLLSRFAIRERAYDWQKRYEAQLSTSWTPFTFHKILNLYSQISNQILMLEREALNLAKRIVNIDLKQNKKKD